MMTCHGFVGKHSGCWLPLISSMHVPGNKVSVPSNLQCREHRCPCARDGPSQPTLRAEDACCGLDNHNVFAQPGPSCIQKKNLSVRVFNAKYATLPPGSYGHGFILIQTDNHESNLMPLGKTVGLQHIQVFGIAKLTPMVEWSGETSSKRAECLLTTAEPGSGERNVFVLPGYVHGDFRCNSSCSANWQTLVVARELTCLRIMP